MYKEYKGGVEVLVRIIRNNEGNEERGGGKVIMSRRKG
jgi:hypothetical protein